MERRRQCLHVSSVAVGADAHPQFHDHHIANGRITAPENAPDTFLYRRVSLPPQEMNEAGRIDQRHDSGGNSLVRKAASSSGLMNVSESPRRSASSAILARRFISSSARNTVSRLVRECVSRIASSSMSVGISSVVFIHIYSQIYPYFPENPYGFKYSPQPLADLRRFLR